MSRGKYSLHTLKSSYNSHFAEVPDVKLQRSVFDRSHTHKTAFGISTTDGTTIKEMGSFLVPVYVDEVLPGDTFQMDATALVRLATPLLPLMDSLKIDLHAFYVPNRILWNHWEAFLGAQDNPGDKTDYLIPEIHLDAKGAKVNNLYDYMGIPPQIGNLHFNALPFRAYNYIWNYWFRDENLQKSAVMNFEDGGDKPTDFGLLPRNTRHDYFHSALPWTQKGTAPRVDIGGIVPVTSTGSLTANVNGQTSNPLYAYDQDTGNFRLGFGGEPNTFKPGNLQSINGLQVKLADATGFTINALRQAFQIQKYLERQARGGTRIKEWLQSHFRVSVPDSRVQYPEFLAAGVIDMGMATVPQTSSTDKTSPQGNLAAFSVSAGGLHFRKSFVEHGYIMILASVRAPYTYSQGLSRMYTRSTPYDFYLPEFSHLGEQPIRNDELLATGTDSDSKPFGYMERYAEYRWNPNRASGLMRVQVPDNISVWHQGIKYGGADGVPATLSDAFIREQPPVGRVLAVPTQPHFIADFSFQLKCARPMPVFAAPGLIDHF